jgi:hypothetical protein
MEYGKMKKRDRTLAAYVRAPYFYLEIRTAI